MKKNLVICLLVALALTACDANKGKVKSAAEEFIEAVKSNDKPVYCEQYALLRNNDDVQVSSDLDGSLSVDALKGDSLYEVSVGDKVKLVYRTSKDGCEIVDSHSLLIFPSSYSELASKTGMPMSKLSDKKIMKLMGDDGQFVNYLYNKNYSLSNLFISISNQRYNWGTNYGQCYCKITNNLTNNGTKTIDASDYEIVSTICQRSTGQELRKVTSYSQSIDPGSTITTEDDVSNLYSIALRRDLQWTTEIRPKKPKATLLAKYVEFKGDEYSKFSGNGSSADE